MSKLKSNSRALPGFGAIASLDQAKIHYQMSSRQDSVRDTKRSIIPQLKMEGVPPGCIRLGGEDGGGLYCFDGGGIGDDGGPGGGAAKASCLSGDGLKLCHCSRNCYATQYTCYCTN